MASKWERTLFNIEEILLVKGHVAFEAANRLQVMRFENINYLVFTPVFKETIEIISNGGLPWIEYMDILDIPYDQDVLSCDDYLWKMATSLVLFHLSRLEISYKREDRINATNMVYSYFSKYWADALNEWTRKRHDWLNALHRLTEHDAQINLSREEVRGLLMYIDEFGTVGDIRIMKPVADVWSLLLDEYRSLTGEYFESDPRKS